MATTIGYGGCGNISIKLSGEQIRQIYGFENSNTLLVQERNQRTYGLLGLQMRDSSFPYVIIMTIIVIRFYYRSYQQ